MKIRKILKQVTILTATVVSVSVLSACHKASNSTDTIAKSSSTKSSSQKNLEKLKAEKQASIETSMEKESSQEKWANSVKDNVYNILYKINDYRGIDTTTKNMLQSQKDELEKLNIKTDNIDGAIGDETLSDVLFVSAIPEDNFYKPMHAFFKRGDDGVERLYFELWVKTGYTQLSNDRDTNIANAQKVVDEIHNNNDYVTIYYTLTVNDNADGGTLALDTDKWW